MPSRPPPVLKTRYEDDKQEYAEANRLEKRWIKRLKGLKNKISKNKLYIITRRLSGVFDHLSMPGLYFIREGYPHFTYVGDKPVIVFVKNASVEILLHEFAHYLVEARHDSAEGKYSQDHGPAFLGHLELLYQKYMEEVHDKKTVTKSK